MNIFATLIFVLGGMSGMGTTAAINQPLLIKPIQHVFQVTPYLLCLPGEVVERAGTEKSQ
ncbi:MAG: hypothetical protein JRF33_04865 [Deltaproteobacteria bacterium]|nr:hypothetical protein [Deltaproteobacteria bacterium]